MRMVTNAEMKKIDNWAIDVLGIPGLVLMENAGRGCVDVLENYFDLKYLKVFILCGKGNNGGDGFVIGRHLHNRGAEVKIVLLGKGSELKGDALVNYRFVKDTEIEIKETVNINNIRTIYNKFHPAVIVDAIFGTGFTGTPKGIYGKVIEMLNNTEAFVLSVDIPSGINGDNGRFEKSCVIADATATMCLPKRGNYLYPGRFFCGDLYTIDIGIPYSLIDKGFPRIVEFDDIYKQMPIRSPDGNKGTFGQILIVAGARGFSGAAAMASVSALKVGAGLVRLAAPKGIMNALESKLLEVVKVPLDQTAAETISPEAITILEPLLETSDIVVIGPGLTTHPETSNFLFEFLPKVKKPLIIDADAINIIAQNMKMMKKIGAPFIMTPHPGEFSRLIKFTPKEINNKRIDLAEKYAEEFGCTLILKGAPTVIASPKGEIYINPTGNSGLATAGSGDVLVGMVSGFLAQGLVPVAASVVGVFLHGLCADIAVNGNNEYALMAADLIDYIPKAISHILRRNFEKIKRND